MLHVLEFLLKFGVDTVDDLMYCMRYYDDEELMKFIGLPRFQILRLRKAAETWDTSDSAHEAASNPPPPQQEQIVPNQQHHQQQAGQGPRAQSSPEFFGVSYDAGRRKWKAQKRINGKVTPFGWHFSAEAAARALDTACAHHGLPRPNFPES